MAPLVLALVVVLGAAHGATPARAASLSVPREQVVDSIAYSRAIAAQKSDTDRTMFAIKVIALEAASEQLQAQGLAGQARAAGAALEFGKWLDKQTASAGAYLTAQGQDEFLGVPLTAWKVGTFAVGQGAGLFGVVQPELAIPAWGVGALTAAFDKFLDYRGSTPAGAPALLARPNAVADDAALQADGAQAFRKLRATGRTAQGTTVSRAFDAAEPGLKNITTEQSAKQLLRGDPGLQQTLVKARVVDPKTGDLKVEDHGGQAVVPMTTESLEAAVDAENSTIVGKVGDAASSLNAVAGSQTSLQAYEDDAAKREAEAKQVEDQVKQVEAGLDAAGAAVDLLTPFIAKKDPQAAREFSAVAKGGISIAKTVCSFAVTAAKIGSIFTPVGIFTAASAVGDIAGSIQGIAAAFGPPEPNPNEMIFKAIEGLQKQLDGLQQNMDARFDRVDKALNQVFQTMNKQFERVNASLDKLSGEMRHTAELLNQTRLDIDRVAREQRAFANADAQSNLLQTYAQVAKWKQDHPGAQLPQADFLKAESAFLDYAERVSWWDPRLGGDQSGNGPPFDAGHAAQDINTRLGDGGFMPVERNVQYLGTVASTLLKAPLDFSLANLPNPVDFALGARLYTTLAAEWPDLAQLDRTTTGRFPALDRLQQAGQDLQTKIKSISRNRPLFQNLTSRYEGAVTALTGALLAVSDKALEVSPVTNPVVSWDDGKHTAESWAVWARTDALPPPSDARLDLSAGVPQCGTGGQHRIAVPKQITAATAWAPGLAVADALAQAHAELCWRATTWTSCWLCTSHPAVTIGDETYDKPSGTPQWARRWGEYRSQAVSCTYLTATTCVESAWPSGLKAEFEAAIPSTGIDDPSVISQMTRNNAAAQTTLKQRWYDSMRASVSRGGEARPAADELEADRKLFSAYVNLGFPEAMLADEALSRLINGAQLVVTEGKVSTDGGLIGCTGDCNELTKWLGGQLESLDGPAQVEQLKLAASHRATRLYGRIAGYQKTPPAAAASRHGATAAAVSAHTEKNPIVADALVDLRILRFVLQHRAPVLTHLRVSPSKFRAAGAGASVAGGRRAGARISYRDSAKATTTFIVKRAVRGVLRGTRCIPASRRPKRSRTACKIYSRVHGTFSHRDRAGSNSLWFTGRLGGRALAPSEYLLVAIPRRGARAGLPVSQAFSVTR